MNSLNHKCTNIKRTHINVEDTHTHTHTHTHPEYPNLLLKSPEVCTLTLLPARPVFPAGPSLTLSPCRQNTCYIILCYNTCYIILCYNTCYIILCYNTCYIILCYNTCYIILCYNTCYSILFYNTGRTVNHYHPQRHHAICNELNCCIPLEHYSFF